MEAENPEDGDFNPRPPRGGRQSATLPYYLLSPISIHALPAEGDYITTRNDTGASYFNPRPPRGGRLNQLEQYRDLSKISIHALPAEGDGCPGCWLSSLLIFQSTPSPRRATTSVTTMEIPTANFNPRPPRGGRLIASTRVLCSVRFQSTPSPRRATTGRPKRSRRAKISIHALPAEGDSAPSAPPTRQKHFNPRPPRGGRPGKALCGTYPQRFQSTPSPRRATAIGTPYKRVRKISIHALPAEGDYLTLDI